MLRLTCFSTPVPLILPGCRKCACSWCRRRLHPPFSFFGSLPRTSLDAPWNAPRPERHGKTQPPPIHAFQLAVGSRHRRRHRHIAGSQQRMSLYTMQLVLSIGNDMSPRIYPLYRPKIIPYKTPRYAVMTHDIHSPQTKVFIMHTSSQSVMKFHQQERNAARSASPHLASQRAW